MKRIRIELTKQDFVCYGAGKYCPIENCLNRKKPISKINAAWTGIWVNFVYYALSDKCVKTLKYNERTLDFVGDKSYVDTIFGDKESLVFYATEAK